MNNKVIGVIAGNRYREIRKKRCMTVREVARRAKTSPSMVSRMERGQINKIAFGTVLSLCDAVDIDMWCLII